MPPPDLYAGGIPLRLVDPPPPPPTLPDVVRKLRYGADSDFSTPFKPIECEILLRELGVIS